MKTILIHILLFLCLLNTSCLEQRKTTKDENINYVEGLTQLSEHWIHESSVYWKTDKDNERKILSPLDTMSTTNFTITEKYKVRLKNDLTLKKFIDIDALTNKRISESDIYTKRINPNMESRLGLTYNYKTEKLYTDFIDTTPTNDKILANRVSADSLINHANKNGWHLCGTAYGEILWGNTTLPNVPREIDKDSALIVMDQWNND